MHKASIQNFIVDFWDEFVWNNLLLIHLVS